MALNKYMHPRNIYKHAKPNFKLLASQYEFFKAVCHTDECGRVSIDFKSPENLAALSKALLLHDFSLNIEFPLDRLVPTIPLRLNYILWLEDLLCGRILFLFMHFQGLRRFDRSVKILDIGVGASCIYPLLGAKMNGWNFYGTETDGRNFSFANENVQKNDLKEKIKLFHVDENHSSLDVIFKAFGDAESNSAYIDAVMTNPPFFCDTLDAVGSNSCRSLNRPPPKTVSLAARQESQTRGGEVFFCMRLARESLRYSTRVGVFTIMLGKKSSVAPVRRILRKLNISKVSVYEMCQGRVMRWGVAWTFLPEFQFPESEFHRLRKLERPPLTLQLPTQVSCLPSYTTDGLLEWLSDEFKKLDMKVLLQKNRTVMGGFHLNITATKNTWTHCRRKRREAERLLQNKQAKASSASNHICNKLSTEPLKTESFPSTNLITDENNLKRTNNLTDQEFSDNNLKRPRMDNPLCEESDAWIGFEEENSLVSSDPNNIDQNSLNCESITATTTTDSSSNNNVIIQANVYVDYFESDSQGTNNDTTGISNDDDDVDNDGDDDQNFAINHGPLVIKIYWLNGTCREAVNQILCYLKNRLC